MENQSQIRVCVADPDAHSRSAYDGTFSYLSATSYPHRVGIQPTFLRRGTSFVTAVGRKGQGGEFPHISFIADTLFPRMSGLDAIRLASLIEDPLPSPKYLITSSPDRKLQERALESGASGVIVRKQPDNTGGLVYGLSAAMSKHFGFWREEDIPQHPNQRQLSLRPFLLETLNRVDGNGMPLVELNRLAKKAGFLPSIALAEIDRLRVQGIIQYKTMEEQGGNHLHLSRPPFVSLSHSQG